MRTVKPTPERSTAGLQYRVLKVARDSGWPPACSRGDSVARTTAPSEPTGETLESYIATTTTWLGRSKPEDAVDIGACEVGHTCYSLRSVHALPMSAEIAEDDFAKRTYVAKSA